MAIPTETVYGLGADATNPDAVASIFRAKGRPADNPLIVHVYDANQLGQVAERVSLAARRLLEAFAPGPITVVVPRGSAVAPSVSAGLDTVAVRIPDEPLAREVLRLAATPVAAPSANRSGRPSPTTWQAVAADLEGRVDAILRGPRCQVGIESTVVDCTTTPPSILRAGGVSLEQLRDVIPDIAPRGGREAASPGTRHPHYAPEANVRVVRQPEPSSTSAYIGLTAPPSGYGLVEHVDSLQAYAHALYAFFRNADRAGLERIDCQEVLPEGLGVAILDRIRRAAAAGVKG